MAFNTTGQTYTPAELTEQEREDWRSEMGVAKTGGDSGVDFAAKNLEAINAQIANILIHNNNEINTNAPYLAINYRNGDGTQDNYKNLEIHNGKNSYIVNFNGETKKSTFYGTVEATEFIPFTGCHTAPYKNENLKPYTLVRLKQNGFIDDKQPNWEVEPAIKGEKGIFGVVYGLEEEPIYKQVKTPMLELKQIGVNKRWIIAALGDMPIFVCNENGNIEYGDRLTPSSIQGVAMKSTDLLDPFCGIAGMDVNFKDENDIVKIGITKE